MTKDRMRYVEGEIYNLGSVPEEFIQRRYLIPKAKAKNKCVAKVTGIIFYQDKQYIFYPKGFNLNLYNDKQLDYSARLVYKTLLKYKENVLLTEEEVSWLGQDNNHNKSLENIINILKDYEVNGYYTEREYFEELNGNGRINWNATLKNQIPFLSGKTIFYPDKYTRKYNTNNDNMLTSIHIQVINECIDNYGWLYTKNFPRIESEYSRYTLKQKIKFLKKELAVSNSDYKIRLIKMLLNFLLDLKSEKYEMGLLTPYYYYIWEEMLKTNFNHDENIQKKIPRPYWEINNVEKFTTQIPDILVNYGKEIVILDAKYYSFKKENTKTYPGWSSIVKQLYYNLTLATVMKIRGNIFIFPTSLDNSEIYEYIGRTSIKNKEESFGYVSSFFIDINSIMKNYVTNQVDYKIIDNLLESIDRVKDNKKVENNES